MIDDICNKMEVHKCVLCHKANCNKLYKNIDPERIIRAIKFDNIKGARYLLGDQSLDKVDSNESCPLNN